MLRLAIGEAEGELAARQASLAVPPQLAVGKSSISRRRRQKAAAAPTVDVSGYDTDRSVQRGRSADEEDGSGTDEDRDHLIYVPGFGGYVPATREDFLDPALEEGVAA